MSTEKTKYSSDELKEFEELILDKLTEGVKEFLDNAE